MCMSMKQVGSKDFGLAVHLNPQGYKSSSAEQRLKRFERTTITTMDSLADLVSSSLSDMFKKELDRIQVLEGRLRTDLEEVIANSQQADSINSEKWVKDCRRWCERTQTILEQCEVGIPAWKVYSWHRLYSRIKEHRLIGKKVILKYKQLWDLRRCLAGGEEQPPPASKDGKIIHLDTIICCFDFSYDFDEVGDVIVEVFVSQISSTQRKQRREYKLVLKDLEQLGLVLDDIVSYVQANSQLQKWEELRKWMRDAQAWREEAQGLVDQWTQIRGWKTDTRKKIYQQIKRKREELKKTILRVVPFLVLESVAYTKTKSKDKFVFSIQLLQKATSNFNEQSILGRGGFGVVYKGKLNDGTKVAVRKTEVKSKSPKVQDELKVLAKLKHQHLVAILGYCIEKKDKLVVYEYLPRGSLSQHLFDYAKHGFRPLTLKQRLSIALDVGRGVEYLHGLAQAEAQESFFTHSDLRPENILLDDELHAKVAEFGLGRVLRDEKTSKAAGTSGYLSPEYAATGHVTSKVDVYSFGVILMELITGRRALDTTRPQECMFLPQWFIHMRMNTETFRSAVDPVIQATDEEELNGKITPLAELALQCILEDPLQRPTMSQAVSVLAPMVLPPNNNTASGLQFNVDYSDYI